MKDTSGGSEEQYEWEEPRAWPTARSSDAEGGRIKTEQTEKGFRSKREKKRSILRSETEGCGEQTTRDEAQSELGGAVTRGRTTGGPKLPIGWSSLRLLGNGVVPQTAELAWKSLWRKINEDNNH